MFIESDIVIVGGGIAGLSLAGALARDGHDTVVLEASVEYADRVRGESLVPWGAAEAAELGVLQTLIDADARVTETWVHYDSLVPTEVSLANRIPAAMMHPNAPGSVNLRHPEACGALAEQARADGVCLLRGVTGVTVESGERPSVAARSDAGDPIELRPRLVIGADGRSSTVRRQVGVTLERNEPTHMVAGMLVDGLDEVELDHDFLATADDLFMAAFWQHHGQLRLYLCPPAAQRDRFAGPDRVAAFLRSANFDCLPFGEQLSEARPVGPLATYPGDDTWTDRPFVDGVVLVGDAAGHNSPIIGQGLSIAFRDARLVRDALRSGDEAAGFEAYAAERTERMRRLRESARFMAAMAVDECDNSVARRAKFFELQANEPLMLGMMGGMFGGPEVGPAESFDGHLRDLVVAA